MACKLGTCRYPTKVVWFGGYMLSMIKDRRRVTTWKLTEHLVKCDKVPGVEGQIVEVDHVRVFSSIIIFHSHDGWQD